MPVNLGTMRHKVTILQLSGVRDAYGAVTDQVTEVGTYYCQARNIKNELVGDELRQSQDTLRLATRYKKHLERPDNSMFVRFKGVDYDITSVTNPDMRNEALVIDCVLKGG